MSAVLEYLAAYGAIVFTSWVCIVAVMRLNAGR